jgi:O-methyltransferase
MLEMLKRLVAGERKQTRQRNGAAPSEFVTSAYRILLGREAAASEVGACIGRLRQGLSRETFLLEICGSDEFKMKQSSDGQSHRQDADIINDKTFMHIYDLCREFTMTSIYNMFALYSAVNYLVKAQVPGDVVECGVWRGGSAMLAALTLMKVGDANRKIFLYDTFEGMPKPATQDVRHDGQSAETLWAEQGGDRESQWARASQKEVEDNMAGTSYPKDRVIYVKGKVEETIPSVIPSKVALLRLDTDWYESTKHELTELFPRLSRGGALLVDDYGWWKGSRAAVDEYFSDKPILLNRICPSGARLGLKL